MTLSPSSLRRQAEKPERSMTITIPIRTFSEANRRDHHFVRAKRAKDQRTTTAIFVSRRPRLQMPLCVRLVRTGGKRLDDDNLRGALKFCRDGVADVYGVDDGSPLWDWCYEQEPGGPLGVRIEISPLPASAKTAGGRG
jgi:hypothetical protein